jgi:hypothetical protein
MELLPMHRNAKKPRVSLFTLVANEVDGINLKSIFDNLRNYGLVALALDGSMTVLSFGGISQLLVGGVALLVSLILLLANVMQSYLIAYQYFLGSQERLLEKITQVDKIKYKIWCGFLSLSTGGSLMYAMYFALESFHSLK